MPYIQLASAPKRLVDQPPNDYILVIRQKARFRSGSYSAGDMLALTPSPTHPAYPEQAIRPQLKQLRINLFGAAGRSTSMTNILTAMSASAQPTSQPSSPTPTRPSSPIASPNRINWVLDIWKMSDKKIRPMPIPIPLGTSPCCVVPLNSALNPALTTITAVVSPAHASEIPNVKYYNLANSELLTTLPADVSPILYGPSAFETDFRYLYCFENLGPSGQPYFQHHYHYFSLITGTLTWKISGDTRPRINLSLPNTVQCYDVISPRTNIIYVAYVDTQENIYCKQYNSITGAEIDSRVMKINESDGCSSVPGKVKDIKLIPRRGDKLCPLVLIHSADGCAVYDFMKRTRRSLIFPVQAEVVTTAPIGMDKFLYCAKHQGQYKIGNCRTDLLNLSPPRDVMLDDSVI